VPHPRFGRVGLGVAALNFQLCPLEHGKDDYASTNSRCFSFGSFAMLFRELYEHVCRTYGARLVWFVYPALARWATFFRTYGACASEGNGLDRDTRRARLRKRPFICTHRVLAASPPAQVGLSSRAQLCCAHGKLSCRDYSVIPTNSHPEAARHNQRQAGACAPGLPGRPTLETPQRRRPPATWFPQSAVGAALTQERTGSRCKRLSAEDRFLRDFLKAP
jgi:hypothetical protein